MNAIILYGSRYGTAQRYAQALADQTGLPVRPFQQAGDLTVYDTFVYFGSLYAGKILGLSKTLSALNPEQVDRLLVATVGLADPKVPESVATARSSLDKQIPPALLEKTHHVHLRGCIDYEVLTLKHRLMMKGLVSYLKKQPLEKQTRENREIIDTYGQKADFVDLSRLDQILAWLG